METNIAQEPSARLVEDVVEKMKRHKRKWIKPMCLPMVCMLAIVFGVTTNARPASASASSPSPQAAANSKAVGTVKSISGNSIVLAAEGGSDTNVVVQDGARLLQIEPGETDLKKATPLQLGDLQNGDRILVRGTLGRMGSRSWRSA